MIIHYNGRQFEATEISIHFKKLDYSPGLNSLDLVQPIDEELETFFMKKFKDD